MKYTVARDVAERTVTLALERLGRPHVRSRSATRPLRGARLGSHEETLRAARRERSTVVDDQTLADLVTHYGSDALDILQLIARRPAWGARVHPTAPVVRAQVVYAVRHELAQTLADVVLRRTPLATAEHPGMVCLRTCAALMAKELGWDASRVAAELAQTEAILAHHRAAVPAGASAAATREWVDVPAWVDAGAIRR